MQFFTGIRNGLLLALPIWGVLIISNEQLVILKGTKMASRLFCVSFLDNSVIFRS
ncbi:protein of unknown function [Latilactobacillus sakei]|nr:protein of unknown function [Latilactobacillus sakei]